MKHPSILAPARPPSRGARAARGILTVVLVARRLPNRWPRLVDWSPVRRTICAAPVGPT